MHSARNGKTLNAPKQYITKLIFIFILWRPRLCYYSNESSNSFNGIVCILIYIVYLKVVSSIIMIWMRKKYNEKKKEEINKIKIKQNCVSNSVRLIYIIQYFHEKHFAIHLLHSKITRTFICTNSLFVCLFFVQFPFFLSNFFSFFSSCCSIAPIWLHIRSNFIHHEKLIVIPELSIFTNIFDWNDASEPYIIQNKMTPHETWILWSSHWTVIRIFNGYQTRSSISVEREHDRERESSGGGGSAKEKHSELIILFYSD